MKKASKLKQTSEEGTKQFAGVEGKVITSIEVINGESGFEPYVRIRFTDDTQLAIEVEEVEKPKIFVTKAWWARYKKPRLKNGRFNNSNSLSPLRTKLFK